MGHPPNPPEMAENRVFSCSAGTATTRHEEAKSKMQSLLINSKRKRRVWATTPAATAALGRGAKRLAEKFATQLSRPDVAKCIGRLQLLLALERECKLRQGDVL